MNTLAAQYERLMRELEQLREELRAIEATPCPDLSMVRFYQNLIERHEAVIDAVRPHLKPAEVWRLRRWGTEEPSGTLRDC
ncbi:hypothetical protein AAIA72_12140 [Hahella sp. SMD15-11]|uniref:Uncharacterized protein n=1 Tax=Thermohahella caldifontis TaxID=3142973 RepID=A0AB39UUC4_9GAMM